MKEWNIERVSKGQNERKGKRQEEWKGGIQRKQDRKKE